jgi:hypothetical protein
MNTQRSTLPADLSTKLWRVACGILYTPELRANLAGRGEIRLGINNRDTAIVPTLELQRLFGRDRRCMVALLVAKQDDKEQKQ